MHPAEDCRRPLTDPRRLVAELYCLALVFVPHANNHSTRKAATITVVLAWAILEILNAAPGLVAGQVNLPPQFYLLRLFVGILIGRMWGIQFNSIAGVDLAYSDNDDE